MPKMYSVVVFNYHEKKTEKIVGPFTYCNALEYMQNEVNTRYRCFKDDNSSVVFRGDEAILALSKDRQWIWNIVENDYYESYTSSNSPVLRVDTPNGFFVASKASDPDYPGIDIDFIDAEEITGKAELDENRLSRPRVLFEYPKDGELHVLVWNDPHNEDCTEEVEFPLFFK